MGFLRGPPPGFLPRHPQGFPMIGEGETLVQGGVIGTGYGEFPTGPDLWGTGFGGPSPDDDVPGEPEKIIPDEEVNTPKEPTENPNGTPDEEVITPKEPTENPNITPDEEVTTPKEPMGDPNQTK